jgi:hypothetical protein
MCRKQIAPCVFENKEDKVRRHQQHNVVKKELVNKSDQTQLCKQNTCWMDAGGRKVISLYRLGQHIICKAGRRGEDDIKSVNDQQVEQVYLIELAQSSSQRL